MTRNPCSRKKPREPSSTPTRIDRVNVLAMTDAINPAAATGFERGAADYEKARPSYAAEAIELIERVASLGPGKRVLDLAAGTGKLTRQLMVSGAELVAVEPVV